MTLAAAPSISTASASGSVPGTTPAAPTVSHRYLRSKLRVGSSHLPRHFQKDETVFARDDIPSRQRARVNEVRAWKQRSMALLPMGRRPSFSLSTYVRPVPQRCCLVLEKDQRSGFAYNYRAEVLLSKVPAPPPCRSKFSVCAVSTADISTCIALREAYPGNAVRHPKRTEELPVHPALAGKPAWNGSSVLTPAERRAIAAADSATVAAAQQCAATRFGGAKGNAVATALPVRPYTSPETLYRLTEREARGVRRVVRAAQAQEDGGAADARR
ncbi:unnamed protein product, partial [Phaeothamnion confervicola]